MKTAAISGGLLTTLIATLCGTSLGTGFCLGQLISFTPDSANGGTIQLAAESTTFGYQFTVGNSPILVNALGVWDQNGAALNSSHDVGIWDASQVEIASGTVPSGASGNLDSSSFRYVSISPVELAAHSTYTIGAYYPSGNTDTIAYNQSSTSPSSFLSGPITGENSNGGEAVLTFPGGSVSDSSGVFGPNAEFTTVVPEPGATAFAAALALVGFAFWRRTHSKATVVG